MLERAKERTAAEFGVVQAVLQRPAALPLPSAGANLRRVRPVTAGTSAAYRREHRARRGGNGYGRAGRTSSACRTEPRQLRRECGCGGMDCALCGG